MSKLLPKQPNSGLIDGIRCLQGVVSQSHFVGVSELAEQLGLDQTRVHRLLRTLAHMGFTQQNRSRKYGPGPAIYALAAQTLYASHFIRDALPPLENLRRKTPHIVAMGVLWNRSVSYLYHAKKGTPLERAIGTFGIWEASDSGIGLAILAQLSEEEVREQYLHHEVDFFENGIEGLLTKLQEVRNAGYAQIVTHGERKDTTIAKQLPFNPMVGLGISGQIKKGEVAELLELMDQAIDEIEQRSKESNQEPVKNVFGKIV